MYTSLFRTGFPTNPSAFEPLCLAETLSSDRPCGVNNTDVNIY